MNIMTFKSNKSNIKNKNKNLNIKEFYQKNKDRYYNQFWKKEENRNNNNVIKQNKNFVEAIKEKPNCVKCGIVQDSIQNKGIYKCENCRGFICGKCSKFHYLRNPEHKCYYININDELVLDKSKSTNDILKDKSKVNKLSNSNEKESSKCDINQNKLFNKIKCNDFNFSRNCFICNSLFPLNTDKIILTNCKNCKANLCAVCNKTHSEKYPIHNSIQIKLILMKDNMSYDNYLLPKLFCGKCQKQKKDSDILYYCEKCQNNVCEECEIEYNNTNSEHSLYLIKRILIKDEINIKNKEEIICRQCETNLGDNGLAFRQCNHCHINLCIPCSKSHLEKYNNHNIIYSIVKESGIITKDNNRYVHQSNLFDKENKNTKKEIELENNETNPIKMFNINEINRSKKNPNFDYNKTESKIMNCINCNNPVKEINNSNFCFGYLCPSCINLSDQNFYLYTKINPLNLSKIILNEYSNNSKNNITTENNLNKCKDCNTDKKLSYFCIICNSKLCNNCSEIHNDEYADHLIILLKTGNNPNILNKGKYPNCNKDNIDYNNNHDKLI